MVSVNRLFITLVAVSSVVKFFEGLTFYVYGTKDCFILAKSNAGLLTLYGVLILVTDYSLIGTVLFMFYSRVKFSRPKVRII
jgi:hypothetical protein